MLNALIRFSLAQRPLVLAFALVVMVWGVKTTTELPVEVLPDLTKPTVTLLTETPGFAPEEVETLVTIPLENALMGVTGVTRLRSVNDVGLSLIFIEFDWGTDIYQARQFVQERITGVAEGLPEGVNPYMTPVASLMGNIMLIGLFDPTGQTSPRDLRTLADWTVARRLQSLPGIAEVLSMGGGIKQVQVQPLPDRMLALGVSFEQIHDAASNAVRNSTGGFLTESAQEIMVRNLAMTTDLDEIGDTVVSYENDRPIRLRDVANIVWDTEPMRGDAGLGTKLDLEGNFDPHAPKRGYEGVILSVTKSPGFDTLALTDEVEEAMGVLSETLPDGVRLITVYRQSDFIDLSIGNLEEALRDGAIMVAVVLFLFLLNFRITLITLTAIPLSLGITVIVFDLWGLSVNSMTLGGLAVAIGMVVDDAIVDVENVFRRLRENASLEEPKPPLEVIARASAEVRSSILYATVLIILVFLPLLALSGVEGRLFSPIAIATMVSMAASFIVSLTVIPVLSSYLLKPKPGKAHRDGPVARGLKSFFEYTWLRFALRQPLVVVLLTGGLLYFAYASFTQMGGNFLPPFREPTVVIATTTAPGTSLKQTTELALTAQDLLLQVPEVKTVGYRVGRAEKGDHVVPVSTVEFDVEFREGFGRPRGEIMADLRAKMKGIPGTFSAMSGPLADRIGHMLSGVSAKIAVKVYGPDLEVLRSLGTEIAGIAREIPGLEEARIEQQAPIPQLRIEVDRKRALAYGVTPGELNQQLASLMGGDSVAEIYEGQRVYDLVVRLPLEWRESPSRLANLYIDTKSGQRIPLSYVAEIRQATGPNTILRENTIRRFVVSINPTIDDLNAVVEQLQAEVKETVQLPTGYTISFEGEYEAQQEARRVIVITSAVVLLVIIFLLYSYFKGFGFVVLVLTIVPMSLIGSVLYTRYTLNNVSIATLVGFIAVAGIAARNNIMLISHYLHLMRQEGETFSRKMVVRGTLERLIPILMTAISAGLALIPLVLAADEPGKEILNPVAIVIIGGLVSSTLLGLGVTPALFLSFCRKAAMKSIRLKAAASD
ncbi:efflux RND transporter permease subunit [Pelagicoccus sp. SDUM812002]|uniref:efflux RND transporter permease subunit n=1 Tax=Pelagicoccus sp. SDUM812002 TaxID=3041266 RepID=UPI00280D6428|nr:efflux RND transporter permease subunit [Pelagicoccus sp. SDUM812002]MDQ8184168.1 efflux RND transporter permease subunit [Pelagicoccus sp. SDUM812002]